MSPAINETHLLWKAAQTLERLGVPTHEALRLLVAQEGIDLATAALYLHVRQQHRAFLEEVEGYEPVAGRLPALSAAVWIVPAAGYLERPEYGGDGGVIRSIVHDFGAETRLVPTRSLGSVADNGRLLREVLAGQPARSVILVTLSKGAAELKVALREPGPPREAVTAWVNVGGLPEGTPLLDWGRRHRSTWLVVRLLMFLRRIESGFVEGLSHRTELLQGPVHLPPGAPTVSVVGFPLRSHLDGTIGQRHGHISPLGPNDGYGLLLDAMPPGHVLPIWGGSHYLRVAGLPRLFYGVFARLARELG
jgi:hypothetical protein